MAEVMQLAFLIPGDLVKYSCALRALRLAEYTSVPGLEVCVVAERGDSPPAIPGNVRLLEYEPGPKITKPWRILKAMDSIRFQFLHVLKPTNAFLAALFYKYFRFSEAKIFVDYDEWESKVQPWPKKWLVELLEFVSLRVATRLITVSQYLRDEFEARAPGRVIYLPQGTDLVPAANNGANRYRLSEKRIVSYLGYLSRRYQITDLISMFALLHKRNPETVLYVIGDGPDRGWMENQVRQHLDAESVRFWGYVPREEIPGLLGASDVLLLPIKDSLVNRARCPSKILDYLGANRPIVTNRVGECQGILGEEGFYFEYGSAEDFARAVGECLAVPGFSFTPERRQSNSWQARAEAYSRLLSGLVMHEGSRI